MGQSDIGTPILRGDEDAVEFAGAGNAGGIGQGKRCAGGAGLGGAYVLP